MEIRRVQLGRYEYMLSYEWETDAYWIVCRDVVRMNDFLTHGPFEREDAHAFLDARIQREEDLKR